MLGNNHPRVYSRYHFAIVFFHYHATSLCCVWMWSHFKTGEGKISVFLFPSVLLHKGEETKNNIHNNTTTTKTTTIFYSHYSGTRRSRKKKETTENEMMENVLPQFLELTVKLMMLKLNCPFRDSAYRFGISVSTVSWIFDKSD